jgi:hypothetical protein
MIVVSAKLQRIEFAILNDEFPVSKEIEMLRKPPEEAFDHP